MSKRMDTRFLEEGIKRLRTVEDRLKPAMDAAMAVVFEDMREAVHIDTGALKASGVWSSETDSDGDWSGEISFGGPTADYAVFELNRRGHGIDDVFARHEATFEAAIRSAL